MIRGCSEARCFFIKCGCCDKALFSKAGLRQTPRILIFGFCFSCCLYVMLRTTWQIIWVRPARWSVHRGRTNTLNNVMICLIVRQRNDLTHSAIWLLSVIVVWPVQSLQHGRRPLQTWPCVWLDFAVKLITVMIFFFCNRKQRDFLSPPLYLIFAITSFTAACTHCTAISGSNL